MASSSRKCTSAECDRCEGDDGAVTAAVGGEDPAEELDDEVVAAADESVVDVGNVVRELTLEAST
jgi:hypothetical protein